MECYSLRYYIFNPILTKIKTPRQVTLTIVYLCSTHLGSCGHNSENEIRREDDAVETLSKAKAQGGSYTPIIKQSILEEGADNPGFGSNSGSRPHDNQGNDNSIIYKRKPCPGRGPHPAICYSVSEQSLVQRVYEHLGTE